MITTQTNQQWLEGKGIDASEIIKQVRGMQVSLVEPVEPSKEAVDLVTRPDAPADDDEPDFANSSPATEIPPAPHRPNSVLAAIPLASEPPSSVASEDIPTGFDPTALDPRSDAAPDVDAPQSHPAARLRFTPWVLGGFGMAAALATVVTLVSTLMNGPTETVAAPMSTVAPRVIEVPAASPPPDADGPLPFTASADCPAGSTSAQSVAEPDSTTPWICVRSVDGQVLEIDLGRTYVITAVSIVPGAVTQADGRADQPDPWLAHRVVTRLQWSFNDTTRTVKSQNTGNVRGEAVEALLPPVVASKITVIIQETSRPPAIAPTNTPAPQASSQGTILGDILGGTDHTSDVGMGSELGPVPTTRTGRDGDAADGTFAVSAIKIIGHKAA